MIDEILTTEPPPVFAISNAARVVPRNTLVALIAISFSHPASASSSPTELPLMPALFTRTSSLPYVAMVDAGTIELVHGSGVKVVSSADLVQKFEACWTPQQLESHLAAGKIIDRVIRVLLDTEDADSAKRALALSARYLRAVESVANDSAKGHLSEAQWGEEVNRGRARALVLQARATGNAGDPEAAFRLALKSWACCRLRSRPTCILPPA